MASKIQVKRGNKSDLPILSDGEYGFCQDTSEIFIGNGGTNTKIYPTTSLDASSVTVEDIESMFESVNVEGVLSELGESILDILNGVITVGKASDANTVGGFTVAKNVPANAKFTDTIYTHPTSHPASMITGLPTSLPADGGNADTVGGFTVGTNVPANAEFTDTNTITTINGKTGAISKADITALGIPAQDTVYTHPGSGTNPHGTTKSDVGLGNVTNDKQMPISGGVLGDYREKLETVNPSGRLALSLGNVFQHTPIGNTKYSITNAVNGQAHSFTLIINMGSTVRTLTFPASVKWQGGEIPDMSTTNKTYVLTFVTINGGTTWLGMFGGEF